MIKQILLLGLCCSAGSFTLAASSDSASATYPAALLAAGQERFVADCAFCHGRDAQGGSRGLDLTRSELVAADVDGSLIASVVRQGRVDKGMPAFATLDQNDILALAAFVHTRKTLAEANNGGRRSVEPEDLATGSAEKGQSYFAANCSACHSGTGDLAGIANRFEGLALLRRMLYPAPARVATLTVTTRSGERFSGTLAYRDEFTVALTDADGVYRSWSTALVTHSVEDPLAAHVEQLPRYTDADMHDVYAYLQTLRQE